MKINIKKIDFAILIISFLLIATGAVLKWFYRIDLFMELFSILSLIILFVIFQLIRSKRIEDNNDITDAFYTTGVNQKLLIERKSDAILEKITQLENQFLERTKELDIQNTQNINHVLSKQIELSNHLSELVNKSDFEKAFERNNHQLAQLATNNELISSINQIGKLFHQLEQISIEINSTIINNQHNTINLLNQITDYNEVSFEKFNHKIANSTAEIQNEIIENRIEASKSKQEQIKLLINEFKELHHSIDKMKNKEELEKDFLTLKEIILDNRSSSDTAFSKLGDSLTKQSDLNQENHKSIETELISLNELISKNQDNINSAYSQINDSLIKQIDINEENKKTVEENLMALKELLFTNQNNTDTIFSALNNSIIKHIENLHNDINLISKKDEVQSEFSKIENNILALFDLLKTNHQQILSDTEKVLNEFIKIPDASFYSLQISELKDIINESNKTSEDLSIEHSNKMAESIERLDKNIASNQTRVKNQINFHISKSLQNTYNQIDALQGIYTFLNNLNHPLPIMRGWPASPDFILRLINLILEKKPKQILDIGSGVTGLVAAYCIEKIGSGKVTSLEHDEKFYKITEANIKAHKLEAHLDIILSPIKNYDIHSTEWLWYDNSFLLNNSYDLVIVDGPPGGLQKFSRYPALPLLKNHLGDNASILLDDAAREDEQKIAEMWEQENSNIIKEYFNEDEKGTFLFTINHSK